MSDPPHKTRARNGSAVRSAMSWTSTVCINGHLQQEGCLSVCGQLHCSETFGNQQLPNACGKSMAIYSKYIQEYIHTHTHSIDK